MLLGIRVLVKFWEIQLGMMSSMCGIKML